MWGSVWPLLLSAGPTNTWQKSHSQSCCSEVVLVLKSQIFQKMMETNSNRLARLFSQYHLEYSCSNAKDLLKVYFCFLLTYHLVIVPEKTPILLPAIKLRLFSVSPSKCGILIVFIPFYHSCIPLLSCNTRSFHIWSCLTASVRSGFGSIVTGSLLLRRLLSPVGSLDFGLVPFLRSGNR